MSRYVRFRQGGRVAWGLLEDDQELRPLAGDPWDDPTAAAVAVPLAEVTLEAPVAPTKIVCVGRNYRRHAEELGNEVPELPLLFLKPPSALIGPSMAIRLPPDVGEVHHEAELAVVLGRRLGGEVDEKAALRAIFGLTCANDVTAREVQRQEGKFTRAKGYDTFCPVGPWVVRGADPGADREVICRVDGEVRQRGRTSELVFDVVALLRFVASVMTLEPGDLLLTGTPAGVGPIRADEQVEVEVEGLGLLANPVEDR